MDMIGGFVFSLFRWWWLGLLLTAIYLSLPTSLSVHTDGAWPESYHSFPGKPPAPAATMVGENGRRVLLSKFQGRTVIINFWATWCAPCLKEMPALDRLARTLPPNRFAVLIITEDAGGIAAAKPFLERLKIRTAAALADPGGRLQRALGVRGLPTTFVVLPDGAVHGRVEGPIDWDRQDVRDFLLSIR